MGAVDNLVTMKLQEIHSKLCQNLRSDVVLYYGPMGFETPHVFHDVIKVMLPRRRRNISIVLTTPGGTVEPVERAVELIRQNYKTVNFIVPDYAMSAGTIFCMSGDNIYMSKSSSLGPIDPQVENLNGEYVPAMGYLEQFEKLSEKSRIGSITPAEIDMLRRLDLGDLNRYEQARNLTVTLLKKWLVNYKFKDWSIHSTTPEKKGKPVTQEEKEQRAEEIARALGDISIWHSHSRHICIETLRKELKLKIEDYSLKRDLNRLIEGYHKLSIDYIRKNGYSFFVNLGQVSVNGR